MQKLVVIFLPLHILLYECLIIILFKYLYIVESNIKDYNNAVFEICESITKNRRFEKNAKIQGKLVSSKLQWGKNELTLDSKAENKSSTNEDSSILPTSKILFNENSKYIISDPIKIVPSNPIQSLIWTEIQKDDFNILQKSSQLTNNQLFANDSKDIYYNWKNISCEDSMYYQHKNWFHSYFTNFKSYSEEPEIINTEKVKEPDLSSEAEEALNPIYELWCQDFWMNLDTW